MVELDRLRTLSARVGSDPLLVQAAGGNTSLKDKGVMWIKASGTWLKDAAARDIFVPLDHAAILAALAKNDPACESCTSFVRTDLNSTGLRPSIETTVHALMPQRVVVHVHCVNTIAWAIRADGEERLAEKLKGFDWAFIPYARPGLPLAGAIAARMRKGVDVLVLGNHGLAVAADTVEDAEVLLDKVVAAVTSDVKVTVGFCCSKCQAKFEADPKMQQAAVKKHAGSKESPVNKKCPISSKDVVDANTATPSMTVSFCCEKCKASFDADPKKYISKVK